MYPEDDDEFEDLTVREVQEQEGGWVLTVSAGWSFLVDTRTDTSFPKPPKAGDNIRCYGGGLGGVIRGCFINDEKIYYRTEAEEEARRLQLVADMNRGKQEKFEAERAETDRRVALLPEVFRRRLQKFRDTNPDFRWEYEPYELFCIEQALVIAAALGSAEAVREWADKPYDEQMALEGVSDDHSGNTMGFARLLACHYLTDPELVVKEHGALTPLVGCEAYGCPH